MKIVYKTTLAKTNDTSVVLIKVENPDIAKSAKPGQFALLMLSREGERIPLTIVEADKETGLVTFIFQELGFTTKLLGTMKEGEGLFSVVGPLGHATEIKNFGKVILIGGGVGIAEIYPVAKALKAAGTEVASILGARNKDLLILEQELKDCSKEFFVTTDDGSYGRKGFVTDVLNELLQNKWGAHHIYAVGPIPMMKAISMIGKKANVPTIVSLNALMVDGTGMCGCCRVTVGGKVKFSCIDGPEFDGRDVSWEEVQMRSRVYRDKENHICKLTNL